MDSNPYTFIATRDITLSSFVANIIVKYTDANTYDGYFIPVFYYDDTINTDSATTNYYSSSKYITPPNTITLYGSQYYEYDLDDTTYYIGIDNIYVTDMNTNQTDTFLVFYDELRYQDTEYTIDTNSKYKITTSDAIKSDNTYIKTTGTVPRSSYVLLARKKYSLICIKYMSDEDPETCWDNMTSGIYYTYGSTVNLNNISSYYESLGDDIVKVYTQPQFDMSTLESILVEYSDGIASETYYSLPFEYTQYQGVNTTLTFNFATSSSQGRP